jgi:AhpD family alkylhydroperoxidase
VAAGWRRRRARRWRSPVAGENGCGYCASAHTFLAGKAGVAKDELVRNLAGGSADPRTAAILALARRIVATRGQVADGDIAAARAAGLDDGAIAETVAHVALNVLTNYLNNLAQTAIDFPVVAVPTRPAA